MGCAYKDGAGVLQDNVLAYMWFNLASGAKKWLTTEPEKRREVILRIARRNRDNLARDFLTPAEIKEAQRRTRAWLDAHPQ